VGKQPEELFRYDELQHRVTQKFESLIAFRAFGMIRQVGGMRQRKFQQGRIAKRVGQALLQGIERRRGGCWHAKKSG